MPIYSLVDYPPSSLFHVMKRVSLTDCFPNNDETKVQISHQQLLWTQKNSPNDVDFFKSRFYGYKFTVSQGGRLLD